MEAFLQAAAEFVVADLELQAEPSAAAAAQRSLDESGLLLLGEVHGVRENPLLIRALIRMFGLTSLALEWPGDLAPAMAAFLAGDTQADHPQLWFGDGRITAGHLAVLAERAGAGPLELTLFDGTIGADWSWSRRDEAMAARILAGRAAHAGGGRERAYACQRCRIGCPDGRLSGARTTGCPGDTHQLLQAGISTTASLPGSPPSALSGTRYGSTSTMTRSFSTCLQATKRSFPSAPSHGRQRTAHPDGGMSECSLTRGALRDYRYDQERLPRRRGRQQGLPPPLQQAAV